MVYSLQALLYLCYICWIIIIMKTIIKALNGQLSRLWMLEIISEFTAIQRRIGRNEYEIDKVLLPKILRMDLESFWFSLSKQTSCSSRLYWIPKWKISNKQNQHFCFRSIFLTGWSQIRQKAQIIYILKLDTPSAPSLADWFLMLG